MNKISRQVKWQRKMKEAGRCPECGKEAGRTLLCDKHLKYAEEYRNSHKESIRVYQEAYRGRRLWGMGWTQ